MRTLLELILEDFRAEGHRGKLTRAYVAAWRAANPLYANAKLAWQYSPGSTVPHRPRTRLDRVSAAWCESGNGPPLGPKFEAFFATYRDLYDELDDSE